MLGWRFWHCWLSFCSFGVGVMLVSSFWIGDDEVFMSHFYTTDCCYLLYCDELRSWYVQLSLISGRIHQSSRKNGKVSLQASWMLSVYEYLLSKWIEKENSRGNDLSVHVAIPVFWDYDFGIVVIFGVVRFWLVPI